eukprot:3728816-Pyramimonas_sp.AAC.1
MRCRAVRAEITLLAYCFPHAKHLLRQVSPCNVTVRCARTGDVCVLKPTCDGMVLAQKGHWGFERGVGGAGWSRA